MIRHSIYLNVAISTENRNVREHNIPLAISIGNKKKIDKKAKNTQFAKMNYKPKYI